MGAITDKIRGKAKQIEGRLTGNKLRETEGHATEAKGDIKAAGRRVSNSVRAGMSRAKGKVQRARAKAAVKSRARRA